MYREQEIRSLFNNNNCWKRETKNGTEYFSKDYYDSNYERIEDKLLIEIENEIKN
jgi:hypothetical protein